mmetsp:Transcript_21696/g.38126  ORF Transcript_21696/g.38126 Transcript_21696/m.38126 type:complete len:555 (-) Transcript_21696:69-1733(-)
MFDTGDAEESRKRAFALMTDGQYDAAAVEYDQAAQSATNDKDKCAILTNLAQCYFKLDKYMECIQATTEALAVNSGYGQALYRRSKARQKLGMTSEALQDAMAARKDKDTRAKADTWMNALKQHRSKGTAAHERRPKRPRPVASTAKSSAGSAAHLSIGIQYNNQIRRPLVAQFLSDSDNVMDLAGRHGLYQPTTLDLEHKPLLLHQQGLLSRVDWFDPDGYGVPQEAGSMPPPPGKKDLQLLSDHDQKVMRDDDLPAEVVEAEAKKRRLDEPTEAWAREAFGLQLPQLLSNVLTERNNAVVGFHSAEKNLQRSEPEQIAAEDLTKRVEKTFADAKETPVHPKKKELKPKRILSIVPDSILWTNKYQQILFDELPPKEVRDNDLLLKTVPTPRVTCFGYFSAPQAGEADGTYRLGQNYIWDNRGGYTRSVQFEEFESMLLSYPKEQEHDEHGEDEQPEDSICFSFVPTVMRLKKQKAARLDLKLDLQSLSVVHRNPSQQEVEEETKKMRPLTGDEDPEEESTEISSQERASTVKTPATEELKTPHTQEASVGET